jgi:hypothetical protein
MANKEIEIIIDQDGKLFAEAFNFDGVGCEEAISEITMGVGKTVENKKKNDFYYKQKTNIDQNII